MGTENMGEVPILRDQGTVFPEVSNYFSENTTKIPMERISIILN